MLAKYMIQHYSLNFVLSVLSISGICYLRRNGHYNPIHRLCQSDLTSQTRPVMNISYACHYIINYWGKKYE